MAASALNLASRTPHAPHAPHFPLTDELLEALIDEHERHTLPRLHRLWRYYRNALAEPHEGGGSSGPPAQRVGLPARLHGPRSMRVDARTQREVVIENDIAWRIHTLIDFMFPAPPRIVSKARDQNTRRTIEAVLNAAFEGAGEGVGEGEGAMLWQHAALLGSVYGHVDFLVSIAQAGALAGGFARGPAGRLVGGLAGGLVRGPADDGSADALASRPTLEETLHRVRSSLVIETVEAPRAIALLNPNDYRVIDAYILRWEQPTHEVEREGVLSRLARLVRGTPMDGSPWASRASGAQRRSSVTVTQIFSANRIQCYHDDRLVLDEVNRLGRVPVVHVQNLALPLCWEGLSDVEPLIPLQDELNTRLSDRANRVTMQSFRMWLGKGIENFTERPVGPGQMWMTDNLQASIEGFGGDADSPSERQHIEELREAMDKASGVTPAAAGHIKAKIGNLTSENALRISLMGTLAKVKRKRLTYGSGVSRLCELILHALDVHGVFASDPADRAVEIAWSDPLPIDESRRLNDAVLKQQLGVPAETLRAELGYATTTSQT